VFISQHVFMNSRLNLIFKTNNRNKLIINMKINKNIYYCLCGIFHSYCNSPVLVMNFGRYGKTKKEEVR
jgi:hypothetical protein